MLLFMGLIGSDSLMCKARLNLTGINIPTRVTISYLDYCYLSSNICCGTCDKKFSRCDGVLDNFLCNNFGRQ